MTFFSFSLLFCSLLDWFPIFIYNMTDDPLSAYSSFLCNLSLLEYSLYALTCSKSLLTESQFLSSNVLYVTMSSISHNSFFFFCLLKFPFNCFPYCFFSCLVAHFSLINSDAALAVVSEFSYIRIYLCVCVRACARGCTIEFSYSSQKVMHGKTMTVFWGNKYVYIDTHYPLCTYWRTLRKTHTHSLKELCPVILTARTLVSKWHHYLNKLIPSLLVPISQHAYTYPFGIQWFRNCPS